MTIFKLTKKNGKIYQPETSIKNEKTSGTYPEPHLSFSQIFMKDMNVPKQMKNQFSDFYFSSYHENS